METARAATRSYKLNGVHYTGLSARQAVDAGPDDPRVRGIAALSFG